MTKRLFLTTLPLLSLGLYGCTAASGKTASLSTIYAATTVLSLLLLAACLLLVRKKRGSFLLLFSSVLVVNAGYTLLSVSNDLQTALNANRIAYLGSVFLPYAMLLIILDVANIRCKKWLPISLFILALAIFSLAASPGILDVYYKEVSFAIVNGTGTLIKVYGPLHPLYMIYLLGYFIAMVAVILQVTLKKTIESALHAFVLAIAVFVNIGVWLIEQLTDIPFEFLSVSYIISELFLLGLHLMIRENLHLKEQLSAKENSAPLVSPAEENDNALSELTSEESFDECAPACKEELTPKKGSESVTAEEIDGFLKGIEALTPTERAIFDAYLSGATTKDVLTMLGIKENTLKFHNKNIYGKLGVGSRRRLALVHRTIEEANEISEEE